MALVDLARFAAAVFDLDGTLVDSEPAWEKAKLAVAQQHGRSITRAQLDASVGRSMDELVPVLEREGIRLLSSVELLADQLASPGAMTRRKP